MNRISALIKETPESSLASSAKQGHSKKTTIAEVGSSRRAPSTLAPLSQTSSLPTREKQISAVYKPAVYGILLQQPEWTKTPR